MRKEELNKIIEQLENQSSKDKATFGLHFRENEDEMHIKANKDGFELFACELLKASRDSEEVINNKEKNYIDFGFKENWIEGELIAYTVFRYGCLAAIGLIILSVIIGIYTIFTWFL